MLAVLRSNCSLNSSSVSLAFSCSSSFISLMASYISTCTQTSVYCYIMAYTSTQTLQTLTRSVTVSRSSRNFLLRSRLRSVTSPPSPPPREQHPPNTRAHNILEWSLPHLWLGVHWSWSLFATLIRRNIYLIYTVKNMLFLYMWLYNSYLFFVMTLVTRIEKKFWYHKDHI